jgi:hypothetical protein
VLQSSTEATIEPPVEPTTKTTATATTAAAASMPDHNPACSLGSLAKQPDAWHTQQVAAQHVKQTSCPNQQNATTSNTAILRETAISMAQQHATS